MGTQFVSLAFSKWFFSPAHKRFAEFQPFDPYLLWSFMLYKNACQDEINAKGDSTLKLNGI